MNGVALSGDDTVQLQNRVFSDFADGDIARLTFAADIANSKTGKNGNTIYGLNEMGNNCDCELRLLRGSADDKFLNNLLTQQRANFAGFVLLQGQFVKKLGDGKGNITSDTYIVSGGIFQRNVDAKTNVEGDTEQSVAIYKIKFAQAPRVLT